MNVAFIFFPDKNTHFNEFIFSHILGFRVFYFPTTFMLWVIFPTLLSVSKLGAGSSKFDLAVTPGTPLLILLLPRFNYVGNVRLYTPEQYDRLLPKIWFNTPEQYGLNTPEQYGR